MAFHDQSPEGTKHHNHHNHVVQLEMSTVANRGRNKTPQSRFTKNYQHIFYGLWLSFFFFSPKWVMIHWNTQRHPKITGALQVVKHVTRTSLRERRMSRVRKGRRVYCQSDFLMWWMTATKTLGDDAEKVPGVSDGPGSDSSLTLEASALL